MYEQRCHACRLELPLECKYRVECHINGTLTTIALCSGGYTLNIIQNCKYRIAVTVKEETSDEDKEE